MIAKGYIGFKNIVWPHHDEIGPLKVKVIECDWIDQCQYGNSQLPKHLSKSKDIQFFLLGLSINITECITMQQH